MANLPALVLTTIHGATKQTFTIQLQPQIIGQGMDSDIVIDNRSLALQHARVRLSQQGYVIENLTGLENMWVNGRVVTASSPLAPGDELRLGEVGLKAEGAGRGGVAPAQTWTPPAASSAGGTGQTFAPNQAKAVTPTQSGQTYIPPGQPARAPLAPSAPPAASTNRLLLGGLALIILLLAGVAGFLVYDRYAAAPPPPPTEAAQAAAPAEPPTPTPEPTAPPTETPAATPLPVPGQPLAAAPEAPLPAAPANLVDPFCNDQIETEPQEPVIVGWQQRLGQPQGEVDYVAQWLASAHYELTLDGRPINPINFERNGTTLTMWANLGLLEPGQHYLRLQQFSSRPVSTGLDLEPADGQPDEYAAGPVAEGFCEISLAAPTIQPNATATVSPTPEPTSTPPPTATATQPAAPPPQAAAPLGIFQDFETNASWKRGDQPNGTFSRSAGQVHGGSYAGQLNYTFPTANNDYVVFLQNRRLGGQPNGLTIWVYGDGAGHFLNAWLKDSAGQTWQMSFGQIDHTGWRQMTALIDPNRPWPSGHISGPNNNAIDYPLSFQGFTLDDGNDNYTGSGIIYLDDLSSTANASPPTPTPAPTSVRPAVQQPTPAPVVAPPANSPFLLQLGGQHRYEEPWGAPGSGDPCEAWRNDNWDDRNAGFRGFNVEVILTNQSPYKITDTWPEAMRFFTADGQEVPGCFYGYVGAGPPPNGQTSVTFFTVVPVGQFVQMMRLSLDGQTTQLCLDGRGGASYC